MQAWTNTIMRVAATEPVALSLRGAGSVRLRSRLGDEQTIVCDEEGSFPFPSVAAPDVVELTWYEDADSKRFLSQSTIEVVERHYFALDDLKGYGHGQDAFDEVDEARLYACRQAATEVFEQNAHRSFVHRLGRTKDWGRSDLVWLDHNDAYEILTGGYVQVSDCQLERDIAHICEYPRFIEYLYGFDFIPAVVSSAVLELAAYMLRPTNRPIGATGESTDAGYIHFTTAGRDGATAIPEVNAVIEQFGRGVRYVM